MKEHIDNLEKSFELSSRQVKDAVNPLEVAAIFEKEKMAYVLIGGHIYSVTIKGGRQTIKIPTAEGGLVFSI
ncbi:MAG: hypothetical protein KTR17_09290 [Cellvibrionaceae bacterium]|nr:hypothetical protein [Cellvibrionaceae bacterium]